MSKNGILVRETDGEVLILDTESDRIHQLNGTASLIWRQLEQGASVEEIARTLAFQFDVDYTTVCEDVRSALLRLRDLKILEQSSQNELADRPLP